MADVRLERIEKIFPGGVRAVDGVTLDVADREFLVLLGPSGCGKTTLLRMIAGLEQPTAGDILIGGRSVVDVPARDRDVAMVFQNYALYPHMSVFDNLAFALKMRKHPKVEIADRVRQVAASLGLDDLLARKPGELSGGQKQRVALGRAIVRRPAVFLFDEPLSNLDALLRGEMRRELGRLHRELQATMIYVTHDQVEAMTLGDRIAVMHEGSVQQLGLPLELYDRPANRFVAGFLGTPAMNFLAGTLATVDDQPVVELPGGDGSATTRWPVPPEVCAHLTGPDAQPVTLGIRPEYVELGDTDVTTRVTLPARVEEVQPLGGECLVYLGTPVGALVAKTDAHARPGRGDAVSVGFEIARVHVFAADGNNIATPPDAHISPG